MKTPTPSAPPRRWAWPRPRRAGRLAVAAVTTLSIALAGISTADATPAADPAPRGKHTATTHQVTLITGDRITVTGNKLSIEPGPGRQQLAFKSYRRQGRLTVIPADMLTQVATNRLDRRLFDVTGLIEAGYDDARSDSIPLIVTYANRAKRAKLPGATRELPLVNATAVKLPKRQTVASLRTGQVKKIWLDGKRKLNLDQSVPQIGAPAAWQAGYTGKGIKVAVLDTGIDATHPELAPQLAGGKNFTEAPDGDQVGHGTHVASTIAGAGDQYKGVAPDAKLYDGKVCAGRFCDESALLAGMEWAATEVGADVVNFSIGGGDTPEIDPLEEAVNRLTAQTGTLFVVSAGNAGEFDEPVSSPASADAALAVGAVDKEDRLAGFSSRGPRLGDGAIKPDVTAPGVDIVAAKSKDATIGEPVGDQHLKVSGTSMAAPHTAGAAALLAQQHPDWTATELKAALMSSAKSIDGQTVFQQGAGRVDVAAATKLGVIADPGSVSFGKALWPHHDDDPVTKSVTYRNLGDQPVTLALTAVLTGPDGQPAPAEAVKLSASTITVPAGGRATVELTSDTRHHGADGTYAGRITATGGSSTVSTPVAVEKEAESYNLTLKHLGLDGEPTQGATELFGVDVRVNTVAADPDGTSTLRLPRGEYVLEGTQRAPFGLHMMVQPGLRLTADTTVVLDARTTKKNTISVPQADAVQVDALLGYQRNGPSGPVVASAISADRLDRFATAQLGPALPAEQFTGFINTQWGKPDGDSFDGSPYLYATSNSFAGSMPSGFRRDIRSGELAVVEQSFHATSDRVAFAGLWGTPPGVSSGVISASLLTYPLPSGRRLFVEPGLVSWQHELDEVEPGSEFPSGPVKVISEDNTYRAGRSYRQRLNAAAFTPLPVTATRNKDQLDINYFPMSDGDGNLVFFRETDTASTKLYRDGVLLDERPGFAGGGEFTGLPAGAASYKVESSMTRPSISRLATRIDHAWTFRSAATEELTTLPLLSVRYVPAVDGQNSVQRTPVTEMPFSLVAQPGAALPKVRKPELQVSGDGGKTWQAASVVATGKGRYKAVFRTPAGASVSLKAKVVDGDGNVTEQTVVDAFQLR